MANRLAAKPQVGPKTTAFNDYPENQACESYVSGAGCGLYAILYWGFFTLLQLNELQASSEKKTVNPTVLLANINDVAAAASEMSTTTLFGQLGVALVLGLLVGLQREHVAPNVVGMRTFPLITIFGTVCAILAEKYDGWILGAGVLGVVAIIFVTHRYVHRDEEDRRRGTTTDAAMLAMFAVGAMLHVAPLSVGVAVGGSVAILLQFKPELHQLARTLGDTDLRAIMQFVLITCVVLPVLPNQSMGPWNAFNPRETWLMVVLIVGMSLAAYIAYKFFGRHAGILLGGFLGGAISSTATTVSYARRARDNTETDTSGRQALIAAVVVIMIASTVVYVRVLIEIVVVSREFFQQSLVPIVSIAVLTFLPAMILWAISTRIKTIMPPQENPTQLKSALAFGAMYAIVLLALAAAQDMLGSEGLYAVAALSGLTDMDAITLSTARLSLTDPEVLANGWRLIIVGSLANMLFKALIAGWLGGIRLMIWMLVLFAIPTIGGLAMVIFM